MISEEIEKQVPVSVIIPCFRCADTIERAVESVMAQTSLPAEVWLVEDGTKDEGRTLAKLYELQNRHSEKVPIEVIPLGKNHGCAVARNTGWDAATQPYIAFLDADDAWHRRKLDIQHKWMGEHPDVALTGHGWSWIRPGITAPAMPARWRAWEVSRRKQLLSNRILTPTAMLRRDLPYRFNDMKRDSDGDLWLRTVLDGHPVWRLEIPLAYLYKAPFGQGGLSGDLWESEKAVLSTYWRQVRERRLSFVTFLLLLPWLEAKYLRRLVLTSVRGRATSP